MVASTDMPPHARAAAVGRGHRFAAYPRCSADLWERDVKRSIIGGCVLSWLIAVLCDPGGLIVMAWTFLSGVILAAFVSRQASNWWRWAMRIGVISLVAVVLGYIGPECGTTADFYLRYQRYSREATAALEGARRAGQPAIVAVPDARDSWYWYVYDPKGRGRPDGVAGLPHGRCSVVATNWTHCATS
jgi:hypothetical protein